MLAADRVDRPDRRPVKFSLSKSMRDWFAGFPKPPESKTMEPLRLAAWSAFGLCAMAALVLLYFAQVIIVPVVAAAVTAIIFSPVSRWLERWGLPSGLSALVVITGFVLALAAGAAAVIPTARTLGAQLPQMAERIEFKLADLRASLRSLREAKEKLDKATEVGDPTKPRVQVAADGGGGIGQWAFQIGLFAVLTYFLLATRIDYRRRLILAQPSQPERLRTARILRDMGKRVSSYLFTITMINVALGIVTGAALAAIGFPYAVLMAFAIALLNFLPIIGPILVMAATAVLSLATYDGWALILGAPAIVLVLHLVESQFVSPWVVGRRLEISPVSIFVAIAVLGWMWGAVGAMVAVPLLILAYTFGQHVPELSALVSLIGPPDADIDEEAAAEPAKPAVAPAPASLTDPVKPAPPPIIGPI